MREHQLTLNQYVSPSPLSFTAPLFTFFCLNCMSYCVQSFLIHRWHAQSISYADPSISRFKPQYFTYIFIPADIVCLILQATGGALSSTSTAQEDVDMGVDISQAGLILQVIVLVLFLSLFADFLIVHRRKHGNVIPARMRLFLFFTFFAVILILIRCIYRIYELIDGYSGPNFRHQTEFIVLEGVWVYSNLLLRSLYDDLWLSWLLYSVMCIALFCLNLGHPGPGFYRLQKQIPEHVEFL